MLTTTSADLSVSDQSGGYKSNKDPDHQTGIEPQYLSECSPKDRPWDKHRGETDMVSTIYSSAPESRWFRRLGERVEMCSPALGFAWCPDKNAPGVLTLKLRRAYFCRVRLCPVCQWRRSLMWMARFLQGIPSVLAQHPDARFLFLTLTRTNVAVTGLREALREMGGAWARLIKRTEFTTVLGWIRSVEVTRGKDGSAHPHYHALLMVPPDYFGRQKYVTQPVWTAIWRDAMRVDYDPIVHITALKSKRVMTPTGSPSAALVDVARETLKYSVKPADIVADTEWFLNLTTELHKLRFIASGGILKDMLKENKKESNDDLLVLGDGQAEEGSPLMFFDWWRPVRRYKRRPESAE